MASEQPSAGSARQASPGRAPLASWLIAAGFAAGTIWFGARFYAARLDNEQLAQQLALADVALKSARVQLEAERVVGARMASDYATSGAAADRKSGLAGFVVATLATTGKEPPGAVGAAVWDPQAGEGVLAVENLPPTRPDQEYELWVIDSKPLSAGVFSVGADGRAKISFRSAVHVVAISKFAVSRERNDGRSSHATPGEVVMQSR